MKAVFILFYLPLFIYARRCSYNCPNEYNPVCSASNITY